LPWRRVFVIALLTALIGATGGATSPRRWRMARPSHGACRPRCWPRARWAYGRSCTSCRSASPAGPGAATVTPGWSRSPNSCASRMVSSTRGGLADGRARSDSRPAVRPRPHAAGRASAAPFPRPSRISHRAARTGTCQANRAEPGPGSMSIPNPAWAALLRRPGNSGDTVVPVAPRPVPVSHSALQSHTNSAGPATCVWLPIQFQQLDSQGESEQAK
jgi:hypothetical protein